MVREAVAPPLISTPVAPEAALTILIVLPLSVTTVLLESMMTATPDVTLTPPPLVKRTLSAAVPVAFDVRMGVVRVFEITTSAWTPVAASSGASAAAVASRLRILKETPVDTRAHGRRRPSNRGRASLPQVSRI